MIITAKSKKSVPHKSADKKIKTSPPTSISTENKNTMGLIRTEIKLTNSDDVALFRRGYMLETEIKHITVSALVDTGAEMLIINENIVTQLGLVETGEEIALLADGTTRTLKMVGPINVQFRNRHTIVEALVVPGDSEVLLGAIPLEGLDVVIDPMGQELTLPPDRPYIAQTILKGGLKRIPRPLE